MLTFRELVYSVYGAYQIVRLDRQGVTYFDDSPTGFWHSFWVAVLVAPMYVCLALLSPTDLYEHATDYGIFVAEAGTYVISWLLLPVVAFHVLDHLGKTRYFIRYIVAYNWFQLLSILAMLVAAVVVASGVLPKAAGGFLFLAAQIAILFYAWLIARWAGEVDGMTAGGLVVLDVTISLILNAVRVDMLVP